MGDFESHASSPTAELNYVFTELGKYAVLVTELSTESSASDGKPRASNKIHQFTVSVKVVRHEIRDLSEADRQSFFSALHKFYVTSPEEGLEKYGSAYTSAFETLRMHLYGAADKECDHWHDDAGFLTHHVGITWMFENSLRLIDPTTAVRVEFKISFVS